MSKSAFKKASQAQTIFSELKSTLASVFPRPTSELLKGSAVSVSYDGDHLSVSMVKELATYQLNSADEMKALETMLFNADGFTEYTPTHGFVYFSVSGDDVVTHDVRLNVEFLPIINQVVATLRYRFTLLCPKASEPTNFPAITGLKSSVEEPSFSGFHAIKEVLEAFLYGEKVPDANASDIPLTYTGAYADLMLRTDLGTFSLKSTQWDAIKLYLAGTIAYDRDDSYNDVVRLSSHIAKYHNVAETRTIMLEYDPEEEVLKVEGFMRLLYHCPA